MKWISYYIYYSILGFLFETVCNTFIRSEFSSGILYGPFTPIYFLGFIVIVFLDKILEKIENKKFRDLVYLICSFFIISLLEYIGGVLCRKILGYDKWNYDRYPLTVGKYINIIISTGWSVGFLIYKKYFMDRVNKVIEGMPKGLTLLLLGINVLDMVFSIINISR